MSVPFEPEEICRVARERAGRLADLARQDAAELARAEGGNELGRERGTEGGNEGGVAEKAAHLARVAAVVMERLTDNPAGADQVRQGDAPVPTVG